MSFTKHIENDAFFGYDNTPKQTKYLRTVSVNLVPYRNAPNERAAFVDMLQHELRGRELTADELRRIAERAWHQFLKRGWPT